MVSETQNTPDPNAASVPAPAVEAASLTAHAPDAPHGDGHESHGPLHHHFDDMEQQRESNTLGMWLFLGTEAMMFGGLFLAYSLYRWMYPWAFHEGSSHLNITLGTINTFVLLFSSLTMALAVRCAGIKDRKWLVRFLILTWILGAAFLIVKGFEWTADYHEGLVPGMNWFYYNEHPAALPRLAEHGISQQNVMMYFVVYFCMTGLHAAHMIVGLALVGWFTFLAAKGRFGGGNDQPVEILGLYWHLIDIIWIFLFPLLYLIAGFHPGGGGH